MRIVKLDNVKEENIVSQQRFIINDILLIRISKINDEFYKFLFLAHQDFRDEYIYLQTIIEIEDAMEQAKFDLMYKYYNDESTKESVTKLISKLSSDNLFSCDLSMKLNNEFPLYYKSNGIRKVDDKHICVRELYFSRDSFVKVNIFIKDLLMFYINYKIFNDPKYTNMDFVKIELVKYNGTKQDLLKTIYCKSPEDLEDRKYTSHYTMNCGPSQFVLNFECILEKDKQLINPLDKDIYNANYQQDVLVENLFLHDDVLYLLYEKEDSVTILKLTEDLYDHTNFVDLRKIFIKEQGV